MNTEPTLSDAVEAFKLHAKPGDSVLSLGETTLEEIEVFLLAGCDLCVVDPTRSHHDRPIVDASGRFTLFCQSVEHFVYGSERYDFITVHDTLLYFPRKKVADLLKLIIKSLRPGGVLHLKFWNIATRRFSFFGMFSRRRFYSSGEVAQMVKNLSLLAMIERGAMIHIVVKK